MKSFGILLIVACLAAAEQSPDVACPSSVYSWQHVKSLIATEKAGIFQLYVHANQKAVEGYRTGKVPSGCILGCLSQRHNPLVHLGPLNGILGQ
jgi:hypothetical protein